MLLHVEFGRDLLMAIQTNGSILSWIEDESPPPAAGLDMFAAWPVASFATGGTGGLCPIPYQSGMLVGPGCLDDCAMTIHTGFVACIVSVRNKRPLGERAGGGHAGYQAQGQGCDCRNGKQEEKSPMPCSFREPPGSYCGTTRYQIGHSGNLSKTLGVFNGIRRESTNHLF
jgi:hypothetical protein